MTRKDPGSRGDSPPLRSRPSPARCRSARLNRNLAPQAAAGTPRIAMGPCPGCPWAPKKRSKPKEEGGVRLSAAVRVHRTASHERSPLRGCGARPAPVRGGIPQRTRGVSPPTGDSEKRKWEMVVREPGGGIPCLCRQDAACPQWLQAPMTCRSREFTEEISVSPFHGNPSRQVGSGRSMTAWHSVQWK